MTQQTADRLAIIEATSTYAHSIDQRDWELTETIVADKATLDYSPVIDMPPVEVSKNYLVYHVWKPFLEKLVATQHMIATPIIHFSQEDQAECTAYAQVQHVADAEGKMKWFVGIRYNFQLEKNEGCWKINRFRLQFLWQEGGLPDEYNLPLFEALQNAPKE